MQFPRALFQSLFVPALIALLLVSTLQASSADETSTIHVAYKQKTQRLIFSPASLGFSSVSAGEQKVQTVTMTNAGAAEITVLQAIASGTDFALSGLNLPLTLAPGQSFTFSVVFAPRADGESNGSISFISAGTGARNEILMTGRATEEKPLTANTATMNSGTVSVGATAQSHSVDLKWHASTSKDVIGYNIYRGIKGGGPYRKINPVLIASTLYTDTSVLDGKTYYYVTTAVNSEERESAYSNQARAKIP